MRVVRNDECAWLAVREVAIFQAERLDGCLRKPTPRFNLLVWSHDSRNNCGSLLRILFGHKVDRPDRRTTFQWVSCHQYDLTICHIRVYHGRCPLQPWNVTDERPT
jgi:hypothetical protein